MNPRSRDNARNNVQLQRDAARILAMQIARRVFRFTPWGRAYDFARFMFEFWDWYYNQNGARSYAYGGWSSFAQCPSPALAISGPYWALQSSLYPPSNAAMNQASNCLNNQGMTVYPVGTVINPTIKNVSEVIQTGQTGSTPLYQIIRIWGRPGKYVPPPLWNDPYAFPQIEPHRKPIGRPEPLPISLPRWILPYQRPDPWNPRQYPDTPQNGPVKFPDTRTPVISYGGGTNQRPRVSQQTVARKPPKAGEKEKKFQGASEATIRFFRRASKAKEFATELDDFIDSIFEALPKKVQKDLKGRKTPQEKIKLIYDNWDKIDWEKAVKNIAYNHFEDKVVGRALAYSDKAAKARGSTNTIASRAWMNQSRVRFS